MSLSLASMRCPIPSASFISALYAPALVTTGAAGLGAAGVVGSASHSPSCSALLSSPIFVVDPESADLIVSRPLSLNSYT